MKKLEKILAVTIVIAILISMLAIFTPIAKADTEPNDDFAHAELITAGTHDGNLSDTDTYDYYKITVGAGQTLNVSVTPDSNLAIALTLYNPSFSSVANDYKPAGIPVMADWTTNSAQATYSYYYIEVRNQFGDIGNYTMQVALISQNDAGSGKDAGDTLGTATQIPSADATYTGFMKDDDEYDYYKLTVTAGQTISVNATPDTSLGLALSLYNPSGSLIASDFKPAGIMVVANWTTNSAQATYTYTIGMAAYGYGSYSFRVSLISQNDAGSGKDAGDTLGTATSIQIPATYSGFLKDDDGYDFYLSAQSVTVNQGIFVKVVPATTLGVRVDIYDQHGNYMNSSYSFTGGTVIVSANAASTQTFYVQVEIWSGGGTYTMTVSNEPTVGVPTRDIQNPNANQPVKVSVSASATVNGVKSVVLSYSTNGGSTWTDVVMAKNATTDLYEGTIPGMPDGTTVSYKVTGYDNAGDHFTQDNGGQYYVYPVVPEFPTVVALIAVFIALTLAVTVISKRRKHA